MNSLISEKYQVMLVRKMGTAGLKKFIDRKLNRPHGRYDCYAMWILFGPNTDAEVIEYLIATVPKIGLESIVRSAKDCCDPKENIAGKWLWPRNLQMIIDYLMTGLS